MTIMGMLYNYWMSHIVASVLLELIYLEQIVAHLIVFRHIGENSPLIEAQSVPLSLTPHGPSIPPNPGVTVY